MNSPVFNTNITQWKTIEALLENKGIQYWNVTSQWARTEYSKQFVGIPFTMILLKLPQKFVILVWGNSKFYSIEPRHSINSIMTGLANVYTVK